MSVWARVLTKDKLLWALEPSDGGEKGRFRTQIMESAVDFQENYIRKKREN